MPRWKTPRTSARDIAEQSESGRRHRRDPHLDLRLQHSLRRSDQQRNRKAGNPGHANLHDDPGGQRSRFAARHRLGRHCQPNRQSGIAAGKRKRVSARIDLARAENFATGSLKKPWFTTKDLVRLSRNRNSEYLLQRRKGAKFGVYGDKMSFPHTDVRRGRNHSEISCQNLRSREI